MSRLETLKQWVEKDPNDVFSLYGLAMEHAKVDNLEEALRLFEELTTKFPSYVATYYHKGKTLERAEKMVDARASYEAGIRVARAAGDGHAQAELEEALDELGN